MKLTGLSAISPIDGRYRRTTESLSEYFSEFGLIRYRVQVEVEYFIFLSQQKLKQFPKLNAAQVKGLRKIYQEFTEHDAQHIKDTEKITNHDVKAVEYFLKEKLITLNLSKFTEFIHFGLTSQDINNTSIPLSLKEGTEKVIDPALDSIRKTLTSLSKDWKNIALLAHTHGQPASPTRLGKEMYVFVDRLNAQMKQFQNIPYSAKFGGATGNLNAHFIAFPKKDWNKFADDFVNKELGLCRSQFTTQIEHYDNIAAYCDALKRINVILCIDCLRKNRTTAFNHLYFNSHCLWHYQNVGKNYCSIHTNNVNRLNGYFGSKFRCLNACKKIIFLFQGNVFRQVTPCLTHHPNWRAFNGCSTKGS